MYHQQAMARIGIFGGTFDPLHNGHVIMAQEAVELAALETLIVIPARQAPHKEKAPGLSAEKRFSLLQEVLGRLPRVRISDVEMRPKGPRFTVDTITTLRRDHPNDEFCFLIGSDSLHELHTWHAVDRLAGLVTFLVAPRPGFDPTVPPAALRALPGLRLEVIPSTPVAISSTLVRRRASEGRGLAGYVPECVAAAVLAEGCYAGSGGGGGTPSSG